MKILIISDFTAPYRIAVFKGLSEKFETTTFFNVAKNESRNPDWYKKSSNEFYFEILDNEKAINHYNECLKNIKDFINNQSSSIERLMDQAETYNLEGQLKIDFVEALERMYRQKYIKVYGEKIPQELVRER